MATTPRHHLVPQFLLRRFADTGGKLAMVKREDLRQRLITSVNNACNEAGFYRIETEDVEVAFRGGHDPEAVEKILSVIEARAERAINQLLAGSPPWSDAVHYDLANFTAHQYTRGWRFRTQINELATLSMRREMLSDRPQLEELARHHLQARGADSTPSSVAELIDETYGPGGPNLMLEQPHAVQASLRAAIGIAELLFIRPIRLLRFSDDSPLATSDNPVVTWAPGPASGRVVPLATAAAVMLPIGPHLALSFTTRGNDAVSVSGATRARQINQSVADGAERWIYHHPAMSPLDGLSIPVQKPRWKEEPVVGILEDDGTYREVRRAVQR